MQITPSAHTHNAVRFLIWICALPAADPSRPNLRCVALYRSRPAPVFDPVRTMSTRNGENLENKSQSDDVRRNNIIAAKGDRASPHPCERARCGEHAGRKRCSVPRGGSRATTGCRSGVAAWACGFCALHVAGLPACYAQHAVTTTTGSTCTVALHTGRRGRLLCAQRCCRPHTGSQQHRWQTACMINDRAVQFPLGHAIHDLTLLCWRLLSSRSCDPRCSYRGYCSHIARTTRHGQDDPGGQ